MVEKSDKNTSSDFVLDLYETRKLKDDLNNVDDRLLQSVDPQMKAEVSQSITAQPSHPSVSSNGTYLPSEYERQATAALNNFADAKIDALPEATAAAVRNVVGDGAYYAAYVSESKDSQPLSKFDMAVVRAELANTLTTPAVSSAIQRDPSNASRRLEVELDFSYPGSAGEIGHTLDTDRYVANLNEDAAMKAAANQYHATKGDPVPPSNTGHGLTGVPPIQKDNSHGIPGQ